MAQIPNILKRRAGLVERCNHWVIYYHRCFPDGDE